MPELKNLFIKGKMNKDLDERLVPQGEYRDALNVSVSYSEGSDVGALQNILGNTERSGGLAFPSGATCIGTVRDTENDKVYWFGTSATADYIAELDPSDNSVDIILCDYHNGSNRILNFSTSNLITGVAVLDGVLYFTDDLNEPRQVDIEYWRGVTANNFTTTSTNLSADRITLIKKSPIDAPTFNSLKSSLLDYKDFTIVGDEADSYPYTEYCAYSVFQSIWGGIHDFGILEVGDSVTVDFVVRSKNPSFVDVPITTPMYDSSYDNYWVNETDESDLAIGQEITLQGRDENDLGQAHVVTDLDPSSYKINGTITAVTIPSSIPNCSTDPRGEITFTITSLQNIQPDNRFPALIYWGGVINEDGETLSYYKKKFSKFSYRYKYSNGQYSVIGPFSLPAFIPGDFEYDGKKSHNLGMENTVRKIVLEGWDNTPSNSNYQADIEEIEILYKDTSSNNIYIVDSIKKTENNDTEFPATFEVNNNQIYKALQSNQILRPFDSIPKKAKALEITGNRLIFGNYLQNFNLDGNVIFEIEREDRNDADELRQKLSLKSNRTYQLGVVFLDEYQRQTPVFTNKSGVFQLENKFSNNNNQIKIKSALENLPLGFDITNDFTHFRYFIKEISNEYYNLVVSNVYYDKKNNYYYAACPSADINKVEEGDYLIGKKKYNSTQLVNNDFKFKVLEKNANPPDFLAYKEEVTKSLRGISFENKFEITAAQSTTVTEAVKGVSPALGGNTVIIKTAVNDNDGATTLDAHMTEGTRFRFSKLGGSNRTKAYTVKQIQSNSNNTELVIEENFGADVNDLYVNGFVNLTSTDVLYGIGIEILKKVSDEGNSVYENKFFIKLENTAGLSDLFDLGEDKSLLKIIASKDIRVQGDSESYNQQERQIRMSDTNTTGDDPVILETSGDYNGKLRFRFFTENQYSHADSAYENEPFLNNLKAGNYLRVSTTSGGNSGNNAAYFKIVYVSTQTGYTVWANQDPEYVMTQSEVETNLWPGQTDATSRRFDILELRPEELDHLKNPAIFEIEPEDGVLDIYYDTDQTFAISKITGDLTNYGDSTTKVFDRLAYANCFSFNNGVESDRIRDDYNEVTLGKGIKVSTVFEDNYKEERVKSGLIFSGIYNGKNGINRLNQFIIAEDITEEANPIYGSIQKLNTRDTDLTLLCDDKILKVPARKDLLFQADGNPQVTSTDRFLGTIIPYAGNYGCQHPESFADHIYRAYFVDRTRGKVLRLSGDGITEISNYGMKDYFKDKLSSSYNRIVGSYDENKDQYNVSFVTDFIVTSDTVSFSESVNGWPSRKSFIPEAGISLNNMYYTFKDGKIFSHDNENRNTFYSSVTASEVTSFLNDNPGNIKNFRTLNYQGDSGWDATAAGVTTNTDRGTVLSFVEKEGKFYNYIQGLNNTTKSSLDLKALNVQGLGTPTNISGNDVTFSELNNALQVGDVVYNNSNDTGRTVTGISGNTITLDGAPTNAFNFFAKNNKFNTSGVLGYFLQVKLSNDSTDKKELYSVGSEVSLSS